MQIKNITPQVGSEPSPVHPTNIINDQHSKLFYADLEYDPNSGKVTEIDTGISHGDLDPLSSSPISSSVMFNYRIEVISETNQLMFSGWSNLFKRVIATPERKYRFSVYCPYYANANISVFTLDNQKIWQSKIHD